MMDYEVTLEKWTPCGWAVRAARPGRHKPGRLVAELLTEEEARRLVALLNAEARRWKAN